jgi:outer membrane protein assembly factor BamB
VEPESEEEDVAEEGPETKSGRPAPPPAGILPVGEVARLGFSPSHRPLVFLHGNRLLVATTSGEVVGHDAASGEFRWKLGLPGETLFAPVALRPDPAEVLLSSASGRLFVVDPETGEIRREVALPFPLALPPLARPPRLYLGTPGGDLVSIDLETGSESFRFAAGEPPAALAFSDGAVLYSGAERTLAAIDASSGTERWRFRGRSAFRAPAVMALGRVYAGNDAGEIYCLSASDGDRDFQRATGASVRFPVLVEDRVLYVTSFGNDLYSYQARGGTERYRVPLPGRPASGPVRFGRRLLVATYDGALVEVDPDKGAVSKTYDAPGEIASPPSFLPALPSAGAEWYKAHRIALALRTGEVLLLGHQPDAEEEEDEDSGEVPREREDTLSRK